MLTAEDIDEIQAEGTENYPFLHRDISWLSFNYRVLQEAKDPTVPLLERLKFLAIYSSNLDEFFRVRVANHRNLMRVGKKTRQVFDYNPKAILKQILRIVNDQQQEFSEIFVRQIVPELGKHRIFLKRRLQLGEKQRMFVEQYFDEYMLPFVQPVLLLKGKIRPFLNNASLYLMVHMEDKEDHSTQYAIVKVPSDHLPRFIQLPSLNGRREIIMLDDIVRHSVSDMFPGYDIQDTYSIKLTRDAELYIDDEFTGDLLEKVRASLTKRHVGPASRFVYDREMPLELLDFLVESFQLKKNDLFVEGRYHNNFDFFKFPDFGLSGLKNKPLPPLEFKPLQAAIDFFAALRGKDHLLAFPYHSYQSVIDFFEKAAHDPLVTTIKITQYRVAKQSRIMNALMEAVEQGKQVFVFIEVKARFDEEANLNWGEHLSAAGVKVAWSLPGVKVHSKMAQVIRQEEGGAQTYTYLSTGNFHEETAKIYGDFSIFTTDPRLTDEVSRLFHFLETGIPPVQAFNHLLVGQFEMRQKIECLIEREIANAQAGKPSGIALKLNSIQDEKMIVKLYQASQAGVPIRMIVRGICSVVPGVVGVSENIQIISIVDRYLEHARVFIFHNNGQEEIYLASADLMTRNLSWRVEVVFPVYDEAIKKQIRDVISIQWSDNTKARIIDQDNTNTYRPTGEKRIQSQVETYHYFKEMLFLK
ncbi:MAG: polyphosphate kinase 1 [Saprospiraceae bacterium]|nr:polyphosphate kinase 1 [Saprospiraceae bacterium]MCF8252649.1 polyphosphate kinase 1 [Saprospiraceae bacterium]MCF8282837.1 polyphosphate kinase 1 [Bacteroidales bacterium]MCF8314210.1 polyphosphate kinase 1 [Saprospiraceae bacterium]MCF8443026.1 polyphosphate kinase 1 [Saprospiraceae bacterium]